MGCVDRMSFPPFSKPVYQLTVNSGASTANPSSGVIDFNAGAGISLSASGNVITVTGTGGETGVNTLTGNTGGAISPTEGNLNLIGEGTLSVSGTGSTLTITDNSPSSFAWNDNATTITMAVNNGYIIKEGAQVFRLPAESIIGDIVEIVINGGTSWQIAQAAGQSITINNAVTTIGIGGSITANTVGQTIKLLCITANLGWQAISLIGNPEVI